ncbi:GNAT family N-acetyltransferase [Desulfosporosinus sp. PR]|uniref:GNAT family N-acetyltransferase n=1 Tax=Candidatus Desulfosporosinus nitrosoreducens TaxID=3401928 RepID=UPI0027EED05E|nr:GNAT family N-acetyltransferase [Desulfosporosinus sp. PR]MDQ7094027.1 GNAT family N-acetyltransferase [Desulfosporosinus sp. PR]
MEIAIRKCELRDLSEIVLLNKKEMGYDYPVEDTKVQLARMLKDSNHRIYVATVDDRVAGYVHANNYDLLYAPPMKNIMGIAVSSDYRKIGIGKMLLNEVEKWARDTGAGVRLVSGATRTGAHAFYSACGYTCNKEQKNFSKRF